MSVKNKGSWCEKHNQYARTKFDCPHCELDELRERVAWILECDDLAAHLTVSCLFAPKNFMIHTQKFDVVKIRYRARKAVEELL